MSNYERQSKLHAMSSKQQRKEEHKIQHDVVSAAHQRLPMLMFFVSERGCA